MYVNKSHEPALTLTSAWGETGRALRRQGLHHWPWSRRGG